MSWFRVAMQVVGLTLITWAVMISTGGDQPPDRLGLLLIGWFLVVFSLEVF